jgi:tetratricopeptide (TPR) repeat protein
MSHQSWAVLIVCAAGWAAPAFGQAPREAVHVEPDELERRQDLIGRDVVVDDHVKYYVNRDGSEPDELQLKRTPITFQVPRRLRPPFSTRVTSVVVKGVLKRDDGRLVCAVTEITPVGGDLERLERGLASLAAKDFGTRKAWARWAQRRAKEFNDTALLERARAIEGDALRIESEMKRVGVDAPREWLTMAQDARRRKVAEPEPSAQAHRALRAMLAAAPGAAELKGVLQEIEAFFPDAAADKVSARVNLARWEGAYGDSPAAAYRDAPAQVRKALDRRLWADATARRLELEASGDLQAALTLSDQAAAILPDKPALPAQLLEQATRLARQDLGSLRLSEVKALAAAYRGKEQQSELALKLLGDWLKIQRDRLSATDAEGALELANLHEELVQDRVTAVELLRKAWKIDPSSKEIAEAFRARGFRKVKDDWVESAPGGPEKSDATSGAGAEPPAVASRGLRGLTGDEVRTRLGGKPDQVNYVGSRGQLIEQWIYHLDTKQVRFVNLLRSPGELKPRVIADYTMLRSSLKGGPGLKP